MTYSFVGSPADVEFFARFCRRMPSVDNCWVHKESGAASGSIVFGSGGTRFETIIAFLIADPNADPTYWGDQFKMWDALFREYIKTTRPAFVENDDKPQELIL